MLGKKTAMSVGTGLGLIAEAVPVRSCAGRPPARDGVVVAAAARWMGTNSAYHKGRIAWDPPPCKDNLPTKTRLEQQLQSELQLSRRA
jgi:hypothetical protein